MVQLSLDRNIGYDDRTVYGLYQQHDDTYRLVRTTRDTHSDHQQQRQGPGPGGGYQYVTTTISTNAD